MLCNRLCVRCVADPVSNAQPVCAASLMWLLHYGVRYLCHHGMLYVQVEDQQQLVKQEFQEDKLSSAIANLQSFANSVQQQQQEDASSFRVELQHLASQLQEQQQQLNTVAEQHLPQQLTPCLSDVCGELQQLHTDMEQLQQERSQFVQLKEQLEASNAADQQQQKEAIDAHLQQLQVQQGTLAEQAAEVKQRLEGLESAMHNLQELLEMQEQQRGRSNNGAIQDLPTQLVALQQAHDQVQAKQLLHAEAVQRIPVMQATMQQASDQVTALCTLQQQMKEQQQQQAEDLLEQVALLRDGLEEASSKLFNRPDTVQQELNSLSAAFAALQQLPESVSSCKSQQEEQYRGIALLEAKVESLQQQLQQDLSRQEQQQEQQQKQKPQDKWGGDEGGLVPEQELVSIDEKPEEHGCGPSSTEQVEELTLRVTALQEEIRQLQDEFMGLTQAVEESCDEVCGLCWEMSFLQGELNGQTFIWRSARED